MHDYVIIARTSRECNFAMRTIILGKGCVLSALVLYLYALVFEKTLSQNCPHGEIRQWQIDQSVILESSGQENAPKPENL